MLVGKRGSGPQSAKHPKGRSGFWDLTPFPTPFFQPALFATLPPEDSRSDHAHD